MTIDLQAIKNVYRFDSSGHAKVVFDLVAEIERLETENASLRTAGGWSLLVEAKTKPLRAKAEAWDKLRADMRRADMRTLDTPCRQWVEGLMTDLLGESEPRTS